VDGPAVFPTGSAWSETTITWNTRPARTGPATDDRGAFASGAWVEFDVTPLVTGSVSVSFVLAQPGSDGADYGSREANAGRRPELVVTTG
jgi:hypothetical protein